MKVPTAGVDVATGAQLAAARAALDVTVMPGEVAARADAVPAAVADERYPAPRLAQVDSER